MISLLHCGHGLVVEHVLAKDETGVRFSLAAPKNLVSFTYFIYAYYLRFSTLTVDNYVGNVYKGRL